MRLNLGGSVFLEDKLLKKKIKLNVKTFYGSRKKYTIDIDIKTSIQQIKQILLESHLETPKILHNLKLIYPMGSLKELNDSETVDKHNLPENTNLILLVQTLFFWDPNMKGTDIKLSNNNYTATKSTDADYQTVLGNILMNSGRHYWEVRIDLGNDEEDLFIGIARKNINLNTNPMSSGLFHGYMALGARKLGADGNLYDYGYNSKKGDTIGVLLEYRNNNASLSFYRNGTKCGVAYDNLTGSFYPAVLMNYGEMQVTLDSKAPFPIS